MLRPLPVLAVAAILSFSCGEKKAVEEAVSSANQAAEAAEKAVADAAKAAEKAVADAAKAAEKVVADAVKAAIGKLATEGQVLELTCGCKVGGG